MRATPGRIVARISTRSLFLANSFQKLTASTGVQVCGDARYSSASVKRQVVGLSTVSLGKLDTKTVNAASPRGTLNMKVGLQQQHRWPVSAPVWSFGEWDALSCYTSPHLLELCSTDHRPDALRVLFVPKVPNLTHSLCGLLRHLCHPAHRQRTM